MQPLADGIKLLAVGQATRPVIKDTYHEVSDLFILLSYMETEIFVDSFYIIVWIT